MDDYDIDRPDLQGALISLEFTASGRIQQMFVSDPNGSDESEDFQFVAPPVLMGEESVEDYYPGTILLGARLDPDDPWIVSRNVEARHFEENDGLTVGFEYEFPFLDELRTTGRFYEVESGLPAIRWDVEIANKSRRSVEIGELGFPFALNNVLEGFAKTEEGFHHMHNDRVHVHSYIGGAASYLFAQRLHSKPPGLLICPAGESRWEFTHRAPASLHTPFRWDGIPIVYAHSRATREREGWNEWFCGHSGIILEPGDTRTYSLLFAPAERTRMDHLNQILVELERPAIRVYPSAVAPIDVGIAIEIAGATPTRFASDVEAELETDADDEGGFCFVRPDSPGAVRLWFQDTKDRESEVQLYFTEPIADLIRKRARWIMDHQFVKSKGDFNQAFLPADNRAMTPVTDPEMFSQGFGVTACLADALFLAEKNTFDPVRDEILALDAFVDDFLEEVLQNPADGSVGSALNDPKGVATQYGRPQVYPLVFNLYMSMSRLAAGYGETRHASDHYLRRAGRSAIALFKHSSRSQLRGTGIPLLCTLPGLITELKSAKMETEAKQLEALLVARDRELARRRYPFGTEQEWSLAPFEEAFYSARRRQDEEAEDHFLRIAYAARSLSPSWWWYGSDKRWATEPHPNGDPSIIDKGELALGGTGVAHSLLFFEQLDRDYTSLSEVPARHAFGGLLSIWTLIREDGAAAAWFCPDPASKQSGMSWLTGDLGISLFQYLRGVASWVLPSPSSGVITFGCHFESENEDGVDIYRVRPWDGVGRRVVIRHLGLEAEVRNARIEELKVDARKRHAVISLQNTSDKDLVAEIRLRGMWGRRFEVSGVEHESEDGELCAEATVPAGSVTKVEISVCR